MTQDTMNSLIVPKSSGAVGDSPESFARVVRALRALSAGNHAVLRASSESQLLRAMCKVIITVGNYEGGGVVYAHEDSAKSLEWMDWSKKSGDEEEIIDVSALNGAGYTWNDDLYGQTSAAIAIRTRAPCIGRDLRSNPVYRTPAYRILLDHALSAGFAATSAFPLIYGEHVLGAMFIAASEPDAFEDEEMRLLEELANDLAYGICALRTRAQHREALATIERLAFFDPHTALPNRTRLMEVLEAALASGQRERSPVAMMHLKVEGFYDVQQTLGFDASNELIEKLGRRILASLPSGLTLSRIGDDSFGVVLPRYNQDDAACLASGLAQTLEGAVEISGVPVDVPVKAGIAVFKPGPGGFTLADKLVRQAAAALQQRVANCEAVHIYTDAHAQESAARLALMGELRHAVENGELRLYCQPKVDIRSRQIRGAEALVRWQHPKHGLISPGRFIRLAEQSGMMAMLTSWLLEAAFRQVRDWQAADLNQRLAINLSAYDLHRPSLVSQVKTLLTTWRIRPELIELELTESALIDDPSVALDTLMQLKRLGLSIAIDDFGTGYSGLSYLQQYPIDTIKIDQSFVQAMRCSQESTVIVRSTIELGHSLGLEVVAEGVEDQGLWDMLAADGCDVAQGFFIGHPMPAVDFATWRHCWEVATLDRSSALPNQSLR